MPELDCSLLIANSSVKRKESFRTYNPSTGSALDFLHSCCPVTFTHHDQFARQ